MDRLFKFSGDIVPLFVNFLFLLEFVLDGMNNVEGLFLEELCKQKPDNSSELVNAQSKHLNIFYQLPDNPRRKYQEQLLVHDYFVDNFENGALHRGKEKL